MDIPVVSTEVLKEHFIENASMWIMAGQPTPQRTLDPPEIRV